LQKDARHQKDCIGKASVAANDCDNSAITNITKVKMMTCSKQNNQARRIKYLDKFDNFDNLRLTHKRRARQGTHFICPGFTAKINDVLDSS
jgi:hypothetical protein